jgi:hypothetical protein
MYGLACLSRTGMVPDTISLPGQGEGAGAVISLALSIE